jgi:hypothetical protein
MTKAHKSIFFEVFEDHVQGGARFYKLGDKLKIIIIIIRGPKLKIKNEIYFSFFDFFFGVGVTTWPLKV